jgi:hypothetical protein
LRPDQTASTAHTLTSTSPFASARARTTFSSRSVATRAAFFGQETQIIPAGWRRRRNSGRAAASSARALVNRCKASNGPSASAPGEAAVSARIPAAASSS